VADYRLSAQVISRGKGQSSIASAAYRAAARLDDPTTGEIHDYTRKQGVVYSAVLLPDDAPEWMGDRDQLWRAVEAAEKRRDAQLAREVQLSLPHELTQEQRQALLLGFVQEQFVARGMVADVNIHAPGREGDDRNHHAHVMLTMRSLTGEGFGNKVRDWNDPETLSQWREAWAHHQNRELERHGHAARVDHRSYEAQGVDREPAQHLGPTAADMERKGKASRIGEENRTRDFNNAVRADLYRQQWDIEARRDQARQQFDNWAARKVASIEQTVQARLAKDGRSMSQQHEQQSAQLSSELARQYGTPKATIGREVETIDRRLEARGVRKIVRDVFGRTRSDTEARRDLSAALRSIQEREREARTALEHRQRQERDELHKRAEAAKLTRLAGIERRREEREKAGWVKEQPQAAPQKPLQRDFDRAGQKAPPEPPEQPQAPPAPPPQPENKSWWEKDRTDKTPSLERPWSSSALNQKRPWESDLGRTQESKRERSPDDEPKPEKD